MDRKSKFILVLLVIFVGILSYGFLENNQSLSSSIPDIVDTANNVRSSIQTDLDTSKVGIPTEPISKLQQVTLDDINQYRQANNIQPLTMINEPPSQTYAELLLSEKCLHHMNDNGLTPQGRFHQAGIDSFAIGENLDGGQKTVLDNLENFIKKENHDMMFNDAQSNWGHRDNILDPKYTSVSFGIAYDSFNMIIVEDFESTLQGNEYIQSSAYYDISDPKECW